MKHWKTTILALVAVGALGALFYFGDRSVSERKAGAAARDSAVAAMNQVPSDTLYGAAATVPGSGAWSATDTIIDAIPGTSADSARGFAAMARIQELKARDECMDAVLRGDVIPTPWWEMDFHDMSVAVQADSLDAYVLRLEAGCAP